MRKKLADCFPLYGIADVACGRELRYIYDEEAAKYYFGEAIHKVSDGPKNLWDYCLGDSYICKLNTEQDIIDFVNAEPSVDLDDPMPVDLAEYYMRIDSTLGITKKIAELTRCEKLLDVTHEDARLQELLAAGYPDNELYNFEVRKSDIRFSELVNRLQTETFHEILAKL